MKIFLYKDEHGQKTGSEVYLMNALQRAFPALTDIKIRKTDKGKPITDCPGIFVSASHCNSMVVCAVSTAEVGIDIEEGRELNYLRIAERFFTEKELIMVKNSGASAFFDIWCRKEAWVKHDGRGISFGMGRVETVEEAGSRLAAADCFSGVRLRSGRIDELYYAIAGGDEEIQWIYAKL